MEILTLSMASSDAPDFISISATSLWALWAAKWSGVALSYKWNVGFKINSTYTSNDTLQKDRLNNSMFSLMCTGMLILYVLSAVAFMITSNNIE